MDRKNKPQAHSQSSVQPNEGEGNVTAARRYDEGVKASVEHGTKEGAEKALEAVEGEEGEELRRAEKAARQGHSSPGSKGKKARPAAH